MTIANRQFQVTDPAAQQGLVQAQPLATLVVSHEGTLHVNHVPLYLDPSRGPHGTLVGHVGRGNIYATWPFVKCCLLLSYMGQGAWLMNNAANPELMGIADLNPFYQMLAPGLRPFAVGLSTVAAIIASQALITGAFSLVSEASRLDLMPHMQVFYPAETKGQLYIPLVNNIMWVGCIFIVLLFQNSERMESAYGLAITVTMLMTTTLLTSYIAGILKHKLGACVFALLFGAIELCFFASCLTMFFDGGYVMIFLAALLFGLMYVWRRGTAIERTQTILLPGSPRPAAPDAAKSAQRAPALPERPPAPARRCGQRCTALQTAPQPAKRALPCSAPQADAKALCCAWQDLLSDQWDDFKHPALRGERFC